MTIAITLRYVQHFLLAAVTLLALDVAIRGLGQHGRGSGEQPVAGVDFVDGRSSDYEEGNAIAHLGGPLRLLVESGLDGGLRRVVPHQAVAFVGDQERHAEAGRGRSVVVGPAANRMPAMIEKSLVILAQAIVVFVVGRGECRTHDVELRIARTAVAGYIGRAVLVIGLRLRPASHLEQGFAFRRAKRDVRAGSGAAEIFADVRLCFKRRTSGRQVPVHGCNNACGLEDIGLRGLACAPARVCRRCHKPNSRACQRGFGRQAQGHSQNVRRVGFKNNGAVISVERELGVLSFENHTGEKNNGNIKKLAASAAK